MPNLSFCYLTKIPIEVDLFDLTTTPKLKEVVIGFDEIFRNAVWVNATLDTITLSEHQDLQQVSIHLPLLFTSTGTRPGDFKTIVGSDIHQQWIDLGHRLLRLQELHKIKVKVVCDVSDMEIKVTHEHLRGLLFEKEVEGGIELDAIHRGPTGCSGLYCTCHDDGFYWMGIQVDPSGNF